MDPILFFAAADAELRRFVVALRPEDLAREAPPAMAAFLPGPTVRAAIAALAYDEAWVPDLLAGRSPNDADPWRDRDLLGDDPGRAFASLHERAAAAIAAGVAPGAVLRFSYGDFPAAEGFTHIALYRALMTWDLARHLDPAHHLPPELVDGLRQHVLPQAAQWREIGVLPPEVPAPADADEETRVLCALGRTP